MPARIGILSTAHMHAFGYAQGLRTHADASLVGVWDDDVARGKSFAEKFDIQFFENKEDLLSIVDAVVITSENKKHVENARAAAAGAKPMLCEKPLVTTEEEATEMTDIAAQVTVMTAFPCRFSPAYQRLKARVEAGDIGRLLAIDATNHGACPFGWFVESDKSGGGAMMDHTVHVADLLRDLLGENPNTVYAQTANRIHGQSWEDTAMLHLTYASGVFAAIDASWSRPASYKTWGDVKMSVVGEKGVIELDMFSQGFDYYPADGKHGLGSFGSDLDALLIASFLRAIETGEPEVTADDGIQAARTAIHGYESARAGQPVPF
ncbi:MAG: Gfo/Idh/MocA family oxidoreductase [Armatimonadota bacterium]|nr:Gfo/Idh/MocA family oxidoreductase [Armatimonadota bacterium]